MGYDVLEVCRHVINYSNEKEYGIDAPLSSRQVK